MDNFVINSGLSIDTDKLKNNNEFVIKFNSLYSDLNLILSVQQDIELQTLH